MRHLITLADVSAAEIQRIFSITDDLKTKFGQGLREPLLPGRVLALLFEKQSLRTRVSFESGMIHLGGGSLMLGEDAGFGKRESVADFSRVLSEMVDVVVIRSKRHATVVEFAEHSSCSVINGLTDFAHPCQALADLYTLQEHCGKLAGLHLAWVGDGNNVVRSLV
jgi:ornithine carbamoyltransferase